MALTTVTIEKVKPGEKARKLFDGGGLYIEIAPTGGKLWRYQYRFDGKQKLLALGKYPDVSLHDARERHQEARKQLAKGIDPMAAKKAQKAAGKERAANSFEVIAREWFDRWKADKVSGTVAWSFSMLEKFILPYIGKRPIAEISAPEVLLVLRRIEERGAINTAHRVKIIASQVFRYAIATGRAERDPVPDLRGALQPRPQAKHFSAFTDPAKVGELLRAIDAYHGGVVVRAALRLAPMVFARPGELRNAKWADIDLDAAEWRYTSTKKRKDMIVPLARQAVEILRDLHILTGAGNFVFPGLRKDRAISVGTLNRAMQSMGYNTQEEITTHGFRAMARTLLREKLRFDSEIIEFQLSHTTKNPLGMAYDRAQFIDDRRRMMQAWSDYLDDLKKTDFQK